MRSDKELLELILQAGPTNICHGLCTVLCGLSVSQEEYIRLHAFIDSAKPKWYQLRYYCKGGVFKRKLFPYYWTPGDAEVRIKWLKKQLRNLGNEE